MPDVPPALPPPRQKAMRPYGQKKTKGCRNHGQRCEPARDAANNASKKRARREGKHASEPSPPPRTQQSYDKPLP